MAKTPYEADVIAWAQEQAALLRAGRLDEIDAEHITDEIEDVARAEICELTKRVATLLGYLIEHHFFRPPASRILIQQYADFVIRLRADCSECRALRSCSPTPTFGRTLGMKRFWVPQTTYTPSSCRRNAHGHPLRFLGHEVGHNTTVGDVRRSPDSAIIRKVNAYGAPRPSRWHRVDDHGSLNARRLPVQILLKKAKFEDRNKPANC